MEQEFSISEIAANSGHDRATVRKMLRSETRGEKGFTWRQIMAGCITYGTGNSERLDLNTETALLRKSQREKLEREAEREKGEWVRCDDVVSTWNNYILNCRTRILATPTKLAAALAAADTPEEVFTLLEAELREVLEDLADG